MSLPSAADRPARNRLLRHTLAYLPAQLVGPLAQFATALVLTHALGAADYGVTLLVFALQELAFLVCLSWWSTFVLRYGTEVDAAGGPLSGLPPSALPSLAMARTESALLLATAGLQALAMVLVLWLSQPGLGAAMLAAAAAYTVSRSLLSFLAERARREAAIGAYSWLQIAAPLAGLGLTFGLMAAQRSSPAGVLLAFALAQAVVGGAVAWRLGLWVAPAWQAPALLRAALAFGGPVVLANGLSWLAGHSIRFVVQQGAGAVALGWLSVAWGLATRLAGVAGMLVAAAAYPLAVRSMQAGDAEGAKRQISANAVLVLAVLAPTGAGGMVLAELFVHTVVAAEYRAITVQLLPWALWGAVLRNARLHGWDQLYLLCEAPRAMLWMDLMEAVVVTAAAALGLWWGGLHGAVVATTLAALLVAAADGWVLRRLFGLQVHWADSARVLLAAGLMAAGLQAALAAGWWASPGPAPLAAAVATGMGLYVLALAGVFPAHSRQGWRLLQARWRARAQR